MTTTFKVRMLVISEIKKMKSLVYFLILFFLCSKCYSQINRDTLKSEGYFAGTKATIDIGVHSLFGSLAKILNPNLLFGFSIDIPTTNTPERLIGFNGIIYLTGKSDQFLYKLKDTILLTKIIKTGFAGGVHYTKRSYIKEKYILDRIIGIGIAGLSTDIEKTNIENENDKYYSLLALNLNAGLSFKRAISSNIRLGIKLVYNFTAYSLFNKQIPKDFGTSGLITSISTTF